MIDKFLRAKHWQLFILMFGLPIVFQAYMMSTMFSNIHSEITHNQMEMSNMMQYFPLLLLLYVGIFFGWFWSVAIGLQSEIPENLRMKTKQFKMFFFIPLVYIVLISFLIVAIFNGVLHNEAQPSFGFPEVIILIVPLHLLSIFGIFHSIYFVAKTFKTVELQREVHFSDFTGEFFMIWFYMIGIWILQPKINKMMEESSAFDTEQ